MKIGFFGFLTLFFIALKLTGYIDWEWIWVLAPLWMPITAGLFFLIFAAVVAFIFTSFN